MRFVTIDFNPLTNDDNDCLCLNLSVGVDGLSTLYIILNYILNRQKNYIVDFGYE